MNPRSFFVMCSSAVLLVSSALSDHSALAQSGRTAESAKTNDDNRTAQELLTEVRLLRKTLQRTGLNAYRSQLIVEGIRAQNDKVVRLSRQVDDLREEIEKIESTIPRMTEQAKLMEGMIESETDASKRTRFEFEMKDLRNSIERYKIRLERQRDRETQVSTQLKSEQSKLDTLEGRLEALEREIQLELLRQQQEDGVPDKKQP